jgi:Flp pilus assembly protein TadG
MRTQRIRNRKERGSAFLELALVSLVLLPLFFGVLDYSRVFYYASVAQGAARAGTQFAIIDTPNHANTAGMQSAAISDASNVTSPNTITASATSYCVCSGSTAAVACSSSCSTSSELWEYAQVNTTLTFATYFHYPLLPTTLTVNGKSVMRVQ